jgi:fluoroquinolone transport system permease protein
MVAVTKLMINDLRNITRDRLLIYSAALIPIAVVILCRLFIPWISEKFYNLTPYYAALFMMMALLIPMLFGFVIGFLIMDERDEQLLTVLRVMPMSRSGYLLYRMLVLSALAFLIVAAFPFLTGLITISFLDYLPSAILFGLFTPILALIMNVTASNKVQAFAVMKLLGSVFYLPLFSLFISDNLKYLFSIIPNFWTYQALNTVLTTGVQDYAFLFIGAVYHIGIIAGLFIMFNRKN